MAKDSKDRFPVDARRARTPVALTAKQRTALLLASSGKRHADIARILRHRHRESVSRLIARARRAEAAIRDEARKLIGDEPVLMGRGLF